MAQVTLDGFPSATSGELPAVGTPAPDFRLVDRRLRDVNLTSFQGKRKILSIVPSLDTGVCRTMARTFHQRAAGRPDAVVLVVSVDTPFAQSRFCETEGLDGVHTLSTLRTRAFAKDYGVLIVDGPFEGTMARAVVVLDESNTVVHTELVPEIGQEPDYDAALAALA
jgi:thiol peroxidase